MPTLEKLEHKFSHLPAVAFIGVHSGKFDTESDSYHLKKNILKYSINHPVVSDDNLEVWSAYKCYYWPTVFIIVPNKRVIKIYHELVDPHDLEIMLEAAYDYYYDQLNHEPLPIKLERDKEISDRSASIQGGVFFSIARENAIKSNLRFPHKIEYVSKSDCDIYG